MRGRLWVVSGLTTGQELGLSSQLLRQPPWADLLCSPSAPLLYVHVSPFTFSPGLSAFSSKKEQEVKAIKVEKEKDEKIL